MNNLNINDVVLVNTGLFIIRLVVGLTFIGHGCQKLFGWFGGYGLTGTGAWLESIGLKTGGKAWAMVAGLFELVGGLLFGAGFLTAVGAGLIIVVMIDAAVMVHLRNGYWIDKNGFEYCFILIILALGVALIGPGNYTLLRLLAG